MRPSLHSTTIYFTSLHFTFTDPLLINGFFYCFMFLHFRGNLFTEPLPNNELFRLSDVVSQYSGKSRELRGLARNPCYFCSTNLNTCASMLIQFGWFIRDEYISFFFMSCFTILSGCGLYRVECCFWWMMNWERMETSGHDTINVFWGGEFERKHHKN
jgi:hypothetical protein